MSAEPEEKKVAFILGESLAEDVRRVMDYLIARCSGGMFGSIVVKLHGGRIKDIEVVERYHVDCLPKAKSGGDGPVKS